MSSVSGRVIAGCFALSAFAVAVISGLASENGAAQILLRAAVSMLVCYPVGLLAGLMCARVIQAQVEREAARTEAAGARDGASAAPAGKGGARAEVDSEVIVV